VNDYDVVIGMFVLFCGLALSFCVGLGVGASSTRPTQRAQADAAWFYELNTDKQAEYRRVFDYELRHLQAEAGR
jgi:hypothetical protein